MRRWLLLVFYLSFIVPSWGQAPAFDHYTVENGLSQNSVLSIIQDNKGFMWFGTRFGLNRFDGVRFKVYKQRTGDSTSLNDDYTTALLADRNGSIWVGSMTGLVKYNPEADAFQRIHSPSQYNGIRCLLQDHKGNVWAGLTNGIGFIPAGQTAIAKVIYLPNTQPSDPANRCRALIEDHSGFIWAGTEDGLVKISPAEGGEYHFQVFRNDGAQGPSDNHINCIIEDASGHIWAGTQKGGLQQTDNNGQHWVHYLHDPNNPSSLVCNTIRKITIDNQGRLWIGTLEGLSIFQPVSSQFINAQHNPEEASSLNQNSIYSLCQDQSGSMWIGTYFGGVNVTYAYHTPFNLIQNKQTPTGISSGVVSGITEDAQNNLWIGTEGGGINYLNRNTHKVTVYKNIPGSPFSLGSNLVKVMYRDPMGRIWAGTHGGGLNLYDPDLHGFRHLLYNPDEEGSSIKEITAVLLDHSGYLWAGSQTGLQFFREASPGRFVAVPAPFKLLPDQYNTVRALWEAPDHKIWIGENSGLFLYDPLLGQCSRLDSGNINCLKEDTKGRIWVGRYYAGVSVYDPSKRTWIHYGQKDGLPNDNIVGIQEDNLGNMWFSTDNGLVKYDLGEQLFTTYTQTDGLAGNEFNYFSSYKSESGELFFGGFNGLTSFYPDQLGTNNCNAPIVFTGLRLFNREAPVGQLISRSMTYTTSLNLKANQNVFTVEFALLNFVKSNKNKYAYMLEGFDREWHYTSDPSVNYMNLPPGAYTLMVKGANNDGIWSKPIQMSITILPPLWNTWWAWCLYLLGVSSVLFLVIRYFWIQALLRKDQVLHQAKLNFFTNVSHEIRTRLTLISGPIEHILQGKEDGMLSRQLQHVKHNADRLMALVEELMDFRKAETQHLRLHVSALNIVAFARDIFTSFGDLSASRRIHTDFIASEEELLVWFDPIQMEKVICNLLSNAFKFTPEGGYISLTIELRKGAVELRVTDNGIGIAPEHMEKLFTNYFQADDKHTQNTGYGIGLALSKRIVQLHKGQLTVESQLSAGAGAGAGTGAMPGTGTGAKGVGGAGAGPGANRTCFTLMLLQGADHFSAAELQSAPTGSAHASSGAWTSLSQAGTLTAASNAGSVPSGKPSLLLVEDNPEVRAFLSQMLAPRFQIWEAPNGVIGVEIAVREIPDLIISDIMMPEMDGLSFCETIKSDPRTNHIPVILLTAKTASEHLIHGLERGADVYLTKPFSLQVLELHIRNLLAASERIRVHYGARFRAEPGRSGGFAGPVDGGLLRSGRVDGGLRRSGVEGTPSPVHEAFLRELVDIIESHLDNPDFDVPLLSTKMAMSQSVLYKKVKAITDMSVGDFIRQIRFHKAARLLEERQLSVYEVAYSVGFNDSKYFSREFKKQFGKTPSEYARDSA
jgi:ligand-binding sensor domain-containing protein/signal transduction histidine kinase/AraC-like DNA-binding protein/ActR/RegA family two-component response regulator